MQNTSPDFQPLRLRAYILTGIICDQFLPIDSIIHYHMVREKLGPQVVTIPKGMQDKKKPLHIELPIEKRFTESHMWYYAASFAQWPEHMHEGKNTYSKRFRLKYSGLIDFQGRRGKVYTSRGRNKAYNIKVYYRHAEHVDWFIMGNKEEIEKYLPFITHIGKKTSQGYGEVIKWELEEWHSDWSERGPGNKIMRPLPKHEGEAYLYGVRPPYWLKDNQFKCVMPSHPYIYY